MSSADSTSTAVSIYQKLATSDAPKFCFHCQCLARLLNSSKQQQKHITGVSTFQSIQALICKNCNILLLSISLYLIACKTKWPSAHSWEEMCQGKCCKFECSIADIADTLDGPFTLLCFYCQRWFKPAPGCIGGVQTTASRNCSRIFRAALKDGICCIDSHLG